MKVLLVVCTFTLAHCQLCVKLREGELCGTTYTLPNNREIYAYYGIPYAAPPVGENRFKEPQPVNNWIGTRNATFGRAECVQFTFDSKNSQMKGNEDCLHLNVFKPKDSLQKIPDDELMNVLIYIHGGAFMYGSGKRMHPDYILQNGDIVFVTINYRLGVLGFFSSDDERAPGNNGLKDQVAAFKWVQNNIQKFGGNPNKITIYGVSAGAAGVHLHVLSNSTIGLFHRAISASGSVLLPWSIPPHTFHNSIKLASQLKCTNGTSDFMIKCLRAKPLEEIFKVASEFTVGKFVTSAPFGPVIEPENPNAFLSTHPSILLKTKKVKNIPWMVSVVDQEGATPSVAILSNQSFISTLDEKWNERAPDIFAYNFSRPESEKNNISSMIKRRYFGDKIISTRTSKELIQALGDRFFYNSIKKAATLHSSSIKKNVYCYRFKYRGSESFSDYYVGKKRYGVCHGDDQFYIVSWNGKKKSEMDDKMAKFLSSSIIAFMETGNPNTPMVDWKPISKTGEMHCLNIYSPTVQKMENFENKNISQFWDKIIPPDYPK